MEYKDTLEYHIMYERKSKLDDIIDVERCNKHPSQLSKNSHKEVYVWWKDKNKKHSYKTTCNNLYRSKNRKRSFADWCIENLGEDWQEKYWSDKNMDDP